MNDRINSRGQHERNLYTVIFSAHRHKKWTLVPNQLKYILMLTDEEYKKKKVIQS